MASTSDPPPPRYFKNDAPPASREPYKQLVASLTRLVTAHPPADVPPGGGLHHGPTSIAYLFLVLQQQYSHLQIASAHLGAWSAAYLSAAQAAMPTYPGPRPGACGVADDILALLALGAASSRDAELARELAEYADEACDAGSGDEWVEGRAGFLYLLRMVRASFVGDEGTVGVLDAAARDVAEAVLEGPRPWKWRGKACVGAVHGAVGTVTQVVLTDPERYAPRLEAELTVLLSYQFETGNWPASLPPERDRLVQVCHGAPGVVNCLLSIREYFPNLHERIDAAVERARECIWERGLLTKEPCLCHGITGNALALDDKRCEHFLSYTTGNEMRSMEKDGMLEKSSEPEGLWGGEAGRAWAWAVVDKGLPKRLLGFNDI